MVSELNHASEFAGCGAGDVAPDAQGAGTIDEPAEIVEGGSGNGDGAPASRPQLSMPPSAKSSKDSIALRPADPDGSDCQARIWVRPAVVVSSA
jgi:hypothetical protein